ncbi:transposable element Tc1 transposase [Trichonephila clavipes]|nr:transposable element Tc1 transposase [Trichonephila clavipes]
MWFQHDGAPAHFSADVRSALDTAYPGRRQYEESFYANPVDFDEALVAMIAVVAGDIREMPEVFANVRQSLRRWCETCIFAGGCSFEQFCLREARSSGLKLQAGRRTVLLARGIIRSVPLEIVGSRWTREGTHVRKTGFGTTRKTTRREDRRIVRKALVNPTVTRSTIRADVGVANVPQTISRHLAEANLKSKRPFRALPLTPEHRQLRLQWCQARSMWNVTDWQKVVFSDESWFVLGTDDNHVRVWRRPGERCNFPHTALRHTTRPAGVMVWGA